MMSDTQVPPAPSIPLNTAHWGSKLVIKLRIKPSDPMLLDVVAPPAAPPSREEQLGLQWHGLPDAKASLVGARPEFEGGRVARMRLSGRPRSKHKGSQGQHTTAYAANREVVIAATIGRTEDEARASMADLFGTLLTYPAFSDDARKPPEALKARLVALANPTTPDFQGTPLPDLMKLYLEARDGLPGASLNTGLKGTFTSSRDNVIGKGEGTTLKKLRHAEELALQGKTAEIAPDTAATMAKLYDSASETSAGMEDDEKVAQRKTFVMTMAQAFPSLFLTKGKEMAAAIPGGPNVWTNIAGQFAGDQEALSAKLVAGNVGKKRPAPTAFTADFDAEGGISFVDRPAVAKDSGTMGDHTVAEQLMKNAATGLFVPGGAAPTNKALARQLRDVAARFAPGNYSVFNDERLPTGGDKQLATPRRRLSDLGRLHAEMLDLATGLEADEPDDEADPGAIIEAAEAYMELVDNRPTAVNFGAPAGSHGEPAALAKLKAAEQGSAGNSNTLLKAALTLFDPRATYNASRLLAAVPNGPDLYIDQVAREFAFFFESAYPEVCKKLKLNSTELAAKVAAFVPEIGDSDPRDENFGEGEPSRKRQRDEETQVTGPARKSTRVSRKRVRDDNFLHGDDIDKDDDDVAPPPSKKKKATVLADSKTLRRRVIVRASSSKNK